MKGDGLVISGVSGRYPKSETVDQFMKNLYDKIDFATVNSQSRYPIKLFGVPERQACIPNVQKFDAEYFKVSLQEAAYLDPQIRIAHEVAVEALLDAGIDPESVRGTRCGVYIGINANNETAAGSDSYFKPVNRQYMASRLSQALDLHGPGIAIDNACSASFTALEAAMIDIHSGQSDLAIVLGFYIMFDGGLQSGFRRLNMTSPDGHNRVWDKHANGYMSSECVSAIMVQRQTTAKRIYAQVLSVCGNTDGYKANGITYPSWNTQSQVMVQAYQEAEVNPLDIHYVEAHATGTRAGDPIECRSIAEAFCKVEGGRKEPLAVGAIKSCIGHTLPASGLVSMTKALFAFETGLIPPDQDFNELNPRCEGFVKGNMINVTETTPLKGDHCGINNFGFGGSNEHCLIKRHLKAKRQDSSIWESAVGAPMPRLICMNGRTRQAVEHFFHALKHDPKRLYDPEFLALINGVNKALPTVGGMTTRGYFIVSPDEGSSVHISGSITQECCRSASEAKIRLIFPTLSHTVSNEWTDLLPHLRQFPFAKESIEANLGTAIIWKKCGGRLSPYITQIIGEMAIIDLFTGLGLQVTAFEKDESLHPMSEYCLGHISAEKALHQANERALKLADHLCPIQDETNEIGSLVRIEIGTVSDSCSIEIASNALSISLLEALGQAYCAGLNVKVEKLYRQVAFPVSRGTPNLASLIRWKHDQDHLLLKYPDYYNPFRLSTIRYPINPTLRPEHKYLTGHCIDGRPLLPAMGFLEAMWKIESMRLGADMRDIKIIFRRIKYYRPIFLRTGGAEDVILHVSTTPGAFEVNDGNGSIVVTGEMKAWRKDDPDCPKDLGHNSRQVVEPLKSLNHELILQTADVYKLLRIRGYDYGPSFQGIHRITADGRQAEIKWTGKWTSFVDSMLHTALVANGGKELALPTGIDKVECDLGCLVNWIDDNGIFAPSIHDPDCNTFDAPGVHISGVKVTLAPRKYGETPCLEQCSFIPFIEMDAIEPSLKASIMEYIPDLDLACSVAEDGETITDPRLIDHAKQSTAALMKIIVGVESHDKEDNGSEEDQSPSPDQGSTLIDRYNAHKASLIDDLIEQAISNERILRPLVDIVLENNLRSSLNPHEFTYSSTSFHDQIIDCVLKHMDHMMGAANGTYTIHHPRPEDVKRVENEIDVPQIEAWIGFPSVISQESSDSDPKEGNQSASQERGDLDMILFRATTIESLLNIATSGKWDMRLFLNSVYGALKDSGFALLILKENLLPHEMWLIDRLMKTTDNQPEPGFWKSFTDISQWISAAQEVGLSIVAHKSDSISNSALLLRKISQYPANPSDLEIFDCSETYLNQDSQQINDYEWVEHLKEKLKDLNEAKSEDKTLWLVSHESKYGGLHGLFGELRREFRNKVRCFIDLRSLEQMDSEEYFKTDPNFLQAVKLDLSMAVIDPSGDFGGYFYSNFSGPERLMQADGAAIQTVRGDLSSFDWMELDHLKPQKTADQDQRKPIIVDIHYSALNFRDVMMATGRLPQARFTGDELADSVLGFEFSGIDQNGNRIVGVCGQNGLATSVALNDPRTIFQVPDNWKMEDAATVPLVYVTVYYGLITRGKCRPGESILIHSATGGVGQAAITLALNRGLTVFATVGTEEKRKFLLERFPQIDPQNVASSRDLSFEKMLMRRTRGRGVDLVLNSLVGEKLRASLRCLAPHGRFIEVGKIDLILDEHLDTAPLKTITFHAIALDLMLYMSGSGGGTVFRARGDPAEEFLPAFGLVKADVEKGIVKPLNRTVFSYDQIEDAMRCMGSGTRTGKVLIKMRDDLFEDMSSRDRKRVHIPPPIKQVRRRIAFDPHKSYLIVGGLGGMGLEMACWMVERGARHFVLVSRSGIKNAYQRYRLNQMHQNGASVMISTQNMLSLAGAASVLRLATQERPLGGVFNLAITLQDGLIEKQTPESFAKANEKGVIARHLDILTRDPAFCPQPLDYFVCFSSASNRSFLGQPNYNYANAAVERVCEMRRRDGLHGLAIQWGEIGDVGAVADSGMKIERLHIVGMRPQRVPSFLHHLEQFLLSSTQWLISSFVKASLTGVSGGRHATALVKLCQVMGVKEPEKLNPKTTLAELGIDSLVALEIRQLLEREYDLVMSTDEIRRMTVEECRALDKRDLSSRKKSNRAVDGGTGAGQDTLNSDPTKKRPKYVYNMRNAVDFIDRLFVPLNGQDPNSFDEAIICFVGSDTTFEAFAGFGEKFSLPVIGVNWSRELIEFDSWNEICAHVWGQLSATYHNLETFNFVAHSFGTMLAFEMAQFAQRGDTDHKIRSLMFLDGSPYVFPLFYRRVEEDDLPEVIREAGMLMSFVPQFLPPDSVSAIKQEMTIADTVEEQFDLVATQMRDQFSLAGHYFKIKDIKLAAKLYRQRTRLSLKIDPEPRFDGDILLIKTTEYSHAFAQAAEEANEEGADANMIEDYGINGYITGHCTNIALDCDHDRMITSNLELIVNEIEKFIDSQTFIM